MTHLNPLARRLLQGFFYFGLKDESMSCVLQRPFLSKRVPKGGGRLRRALPRKAPTVLLVARRWLYILIARGAEPLRLYSREAPCVAAYSRRSYTARALCSRAHNSNTCRGELDAPRARHQEDEHLKTHTYHWSSSPKPDGVLAAQTRSRHAGTCHREMPRRATISVSVKPHLRSRLVWRRNLRRLEIV